MQDWLMWVVVALAAALAIIAVALGVALARARSRTEQALARSRAETAALRAELDEVQRRVERRLGGATTGSADPEFVITDLGRPGAHGAHGADEVHETQPAPQLGGALFADLVLRETVVKAASLAHGVRRALDPETRNRIRFEMRREVKRARKQRRAELRAARRAWQGDRRAELDQEGSAA